MSKINLSEHEIRRYYESRVPKLKKIGKELRGPCPIHKGTRESLAINLETGTWFCHSGCARGGSIFDFESALSGTNGESARAAVLAAAGHPAEPERRIVHTYDYCDESGALLYQTVRYEPKDFRQRRPDGNGGWIWNLKGVRQVLYRLPAVLAAPIVFVVEGEKDADALTELGVVATTSPMGAGKWKAQHTESLRGKQVYVIPDADAPGRAHGGDVMQSLDGVAASVKRIELPGAKDAAEWIGRGGTLDALVALAERAGANPGPPEPRPNRRPSEEQRAGRSGGRPEPPRVITYPELREVQMEVGQMLFDGFPLPAKGATLKVGASRSGKTLLAVQEALAIASGKALFDYYSVLQQGAVMIVEQDDPAGAAGIKQIVELFNPPGSHDLPLYVVEKVPFGFGPAMLDWLREQITKLSLRLVVLDSYTALRGSHGPGLDIVKVEQTELGQLDALGKEVGSAIEVIHHESKGAAGLDWTSLGAGTFAMGAAVEGMIQVSRFRDIDGPERLVRMRARRHPEDVQMVLRFRKETLDHEWVLEGSASELFPLMRQIKVEFCSEEFTAKDLAQKTGVSRATAYRQIDRLRHAGAIRKQHGGSGYKLDLKI